MKKHFIFMFSFILGSFTVTASPSALSAVRKVSKGLHQFTYEEPFEFYIRSRERASTARCEDFYESIDTLIERCVDERGEVTCGSFHIQAKALDEIAFISEKTFGLSGETNISGDAAERLSHQVKVRENRQDFEMAPVIFAEMKTTPLSLEVDMANSPDSRLAKLKKWTGYQPEIKADDEGLIKTKSGLLICDLEAQTLQLKAVTPLVLSTRPALPDERSRQLEPLVQDVVHVTRSSVPDFEKAVIVGARMGRAVRDVIGVQRKEAQENLIVAIYRQLFPRGNMNMIPLNSRADIKEKLTPSEVEVHNAQVRFSFAPLF